MSLAERHGLSRARKQERTDSLHGTLAGWHIKPLHNSLTNV